MRGFNYKKAVQALNYLAIISGGSLNKMKAIKLIWLSDRYHLRKYGRLITGDSYFALPNGPVPSATRDVLENSNFIDDIALKYANGIISVIDKYNYQSDSECNLKVFSQTDKECLDVVFNKFAKFDHFKLSEISHLFPEWKRHESAFKRQLSSRFEIIDDDFFVSIDEESGLFNDSIDDILLSKQMYIENKNILTFL